MRSHWPILAFACGIGMFYVMWNLWQDADSVGNGERLFRIALMLASPAWLLQAPTRN